MTDDELDQLAVDVRRQWGERFPVPGRDESATERDLREEVTRDVLHRVVLPELDRQRVVARAQPLSTADHDALVDLVISEMFGLPRLLTVLRDPQVTDVLVFGADALRLVPEVLTVGSSRPDSLTRNAATGMDAYGFNPLRLAYHEAWCARHAACEEAGALPGLPPGGMPPHLAGLAAEMLAGEAG